MRALVLGLCACNTVFGLDSTKPMTTDANETAPRLAVPELFREETTTTEPYLFEGTGYRFASIAARTPATHVPVPIVIERAQLADEIEIVIPPELGTWEICGTPASGTVADAVFANPPCARTNGYAAFTVVVPVSFTVGVGAGVSPLQIRVKRAGIATPFELSVAVLPLDELVDGTTQAGFFSAIRLAAITPPKESAAIDLRSVTDVEVTSIDARGLPGEGVSCNASGCAGGLAGPGNAGRGASSNCGTNPCSATPPFGGGGGQACTTGGGCSLSDAPGGGGGGNATVGIAGDPGGVGCSSIGGVAGAARDNVANRYLVQLPLGGGGGAGAAHTEGATTYHGGGGGGGGGVVSIFAAGRLALAGPIDVSGGSGGSFGVMFCNAFKRAGLGGGGAGGTIRLQGSRVDAADLDTLLLVNGGMLGMFISGIGSRGRIRVDGVGAESLASTPGVFRGATLDTPPAIATTERIALPGRSSSIDAQVVFFGARGLRTPDYISQFAVVPDGATETMLSVPLVPGLNEVCVFVTALANPNNTLTRAQKTCAWVARVE